MADEKATEELKCLIESGEFLLFLGAGYSRPAGLPLWAEALEEIADKVEEYDDLYAQTIRRELAKGHYLRAADQFLAADLNPEQRRRIVTSVFTERRDPTRNQRLMLTVPCIGIVTTNFDRVAVKAAATVGLDLVQFSEGDADLNQARVMMEHKFLLRLHGRVEAPDTIVFAKRQYEAAAARTAYQTFFRQMFLSRNCVFFGYSFADPVWRDLIGRLAVEVNSFFKRKCFALFPEEPTGAFRDFLQKACIRWVTYSPKDEHAEGWEVLCKHASGRDSQGVHVQRRQDRLDSAVEDRLRTYLAAVYARSKSNKDSAYRVTVLAGLLTAVLQDLGAGACASREEFHRRARGLLALPRSFPDIEIEKAINLLVVDGLLVGKDAGTKICVEELPGEDELSADLKDLAASLRARLEARYQRKVDTQQAELLAEVIVEILIEDGLRVAYSIARGRPLVGRWSQLVGRVLGRHSASFEGKLDETEKAIVSLFSAPDQDEEKLLLEVSSLVFSASVMLTDPIFVLEAEERIRHNAFLDASIVLPWISPGHPLRRLYDKMISSLGKKNGLFLEDYLNEVVSHRSLAIRVYEDANLADPQRLERFAAFYKAEGTNTYLSGYANLRESGFSGDFMEYLETKAPYATESEAGAYLERNGLKIVSRSSYVRSSSYRGGVFGELRSSLRDLGKGDRAEILVRHDATQVEQMLTGLGAERYFITADRALIRAVAESRYSSVLPRILLPNQAAYLVELITEGSSPSRGMARALWSHRPSNLAEKLKEYYTDRLLKTYEGALVEEIPRVLKEVLKEVETASGTVFGRSLEDVTDFGIDQAQTFRDFDRFETSFYEKLLEARKRAED